MSIGRYFTEMLDPSMNWSDVAEMLRVWSGQFCLKGIMSIADAKRAVDMAAPASSCPITAGDSSMARDLHLISSLK